MSHKPGLDIAHYFLSRSSNEEIVSVYLTNSEDQINKEIIELFNNSSTKVFIGKQVIHSPEHANWFKECELDAMVSVYWPWLFQEMIFKSVKISVNFHPALLPSNRGWYPHVHNIISETHAGVTLHEIDSGADMGDIWAQEIVEVKYTDTAKELYVRLQETIVSLFVKSWDGISSQKIPKISQDESVATYNAKMDVSKLDQISMEKSYKGKELINLLRARSFGEKGFAYVIVDGQKIFLSLKLSVNPDFD